MKHPISIVLFTFTLIFSSLVMAGSVARGQFTSSVVDREPSDNLSSMSSDMSEMRYFTQLSGMQGKKITHQWQYNYKVIYEKTFDVRGPRWRVWSSKKIHPGWTGTWTVNTLDQDGSMLHSQSFEYQ